MFLGFVLGCSDEPDAAAGVAGTAGVAAAGAGPQNMQAGSAGASGAAGAAGSAGAAGVEAAAGSSSDASVQEPEPDAALADASIDAGMTTSRGPSAGCEKPPTSTDSSEEFQAHDVTVSGVDPAFISEHPANGGSWTERSYYVRLPRDYDPEKPYPIVIGGGGCGNDSGTSGSSGGLRTLPDDQSDAIVVGLNYVYPTNAGACFADDYANTPDLPYFDAVLAQLEADYCVDRDRVFVTGWSSGGWETYLLGCARAGIVRGIGAAAGGLRMTRPPCADAPVAAIMVAGLQDMENPIGPLEPPGKHDSLGSAPARDDILARNGCVGTETTPWDPEFPACVKYTGCPEAYPVVWCAIDAGHTEGGDYSANGFWKFWSSLR